MRSADFGMKRRSASLAVSRRSPTTRDLRLVAQVRAGEIRSAGAVLVERRMQRALHHAPRKEAALLAIGGQPGAIQFEHILGAKPLNFFDRLAFDLLH